MRTEREIAERLGKARAKYEAANTGENPEVATLWAQEMSLLGWALGGEWIGYPVVSLKPIPAREPTPPRELRPEQDEIREVFGLGQRVLVRSGKSWVPRVIESITIMRHDDGSLEPRLWFSDYGNIPACDVIAREDIQAGD